MYSSYKSSSFCASNVCFVIRMMQILSNSNCPFSLKLYNRLISQQWQEECFQHPSFVSLNIADKNMHICNTNCSATVCFLSKCVLTQIYQQWKEKCFQRPSFVYIYFTFNFTITWPQPAGLEAWTSQFFPASHKMKLWWKKLPLGNSSGQYKTTYRARI